MQPAIPTYHSYKLFIFSTNWCLGCTFYLLGVWYEHLVSCLFKQFSDFYVEFSKFSYMQSAIPTYHSYKLFILSANWCLSCISYLLWVCYEHLVSFFFISSLISVLRFLSSPIWNLQFLPTIYINFLSLVQTDDCLVYPTFYGPAMNIGYLSLFR